MGSVWSIAIAGGIPSIRVTTGRSIRSRNCRAYVENDSSTYRPLPFGVEGVEGERGLPGTAHPGDDHERVPGDLEVEPLQVVLSSADDTNCWVSRGGLPVGIADYTILPPDAQAESSVRRILFFTRERLSAILRPLSTPRMRFRAPA